MNYYKIVVVTCLSSFLWACSTKPNVTAPVIEATKPSPIAKPTGSTDNTVKTSSALNSLLNLAKQQESNGNLQAATATLERAARISPRNPEVYLQLAELNYRQGKNAQAQSFAEKALSLDAGNTITEQAEILLDKIASE